jgi:hypothetical protein
MSLMDAMTTGMGGMSAGAALVGNGGISLGNMFLQNLQATQTNLANGAANNVSGNGGGNNGHRNNVSGNSGGGSAPATQMGSATPNGSGDPSSEIEQAMCEVDPASGMGQMLMGKEMYDMNAKVMNTANQMVGTLLDTVNGV